MNVLFTQIGGLTGLFVFLNQMWQYATLEKSIYLAVAVGIGVYVVLVLGDLSVRMILQYFPKEPRSGRNQQTSGEGTRPTQGTSEGASRPLSA